MARVSQGLCFRSDVFTDAAGTVPTASWGIRVCREEAPLGPLWFHGPHDLVLGLRWDRHGSMGLMTVRVLTLRWDRHGSMGAMTPHRPVSAGTHQGSMEQGVDLGSALSGEVFRR